MVDPTILSQAMKTTPTLLADWNIIMPMLIPLVFAAGSLMLRGKDKWQMPMAIVAVLLSLFGAANLFLDILYLGPQSLTLSGWLAPYGISFTADALSALFVLVASLVTLLILMYSPADVDKAAIKSGYYTLVLMLLVGVNGSFLTGDIFNLYVWFEVMLISSFGLLILGGEKIQLDGAVKYAFLNLLGTTFFLIATGLLYGITGTLNFAHLFTQVANSEAEGTLAILSLMFLFAFAIKAAAFPMYFWLPAAYHTPRVAVSAIFAGLLTKVGVYALIRIFTVVFPEGNGAAFEIFGILGGLTVIVGGIGAIAQTELRRMLAYLLMSGVGILMIGISIHTDLALAATVQYAVHSMLVMTGLYLLSGVIGRMAGSFEIAKIGGIVMQNHYVAIAFFGLALAVSGLPPFSGLWPKYMMVQAAFMNDNYWLIAAILIGSFLTIAAVGRASIQMIWRGGDVDTPDGQYEARGQRLGAKQLRVMMLPIAIIFMLSFALGIMPESLIRQANLAAYDILNIAPYVKSTLGG
ncbi:MAG: Na+/H+ antiporter subunit D [Rhizobiales bacterium]|nr:Na+/H+ antiporter subunit D [Hyphomicrobiales bacterium]NRB13415.1 Na+/H+ antiporter subunit D [Hyphomicrobiales bacterium]